mmetsp:Transcript_44044/g.138824  ORF Transcript_44044/g.138824 Transcript_44044/m.138824 type:complete len:318 (+) Transcript_44044:89-1042(+)
MRTAVARALAALEEVSVRLIGAPRPAIGAADPFAGLLPWDLTSAEALEVPAAETEYGAALLDFAGVCAIRRAVPPSLAARGGAAASALAAAVRRGVRRRGGDPDCPQVGFRFHEACQRGPGRLDLRGYQLDEEPFAAVGELGGRAWLPLVRRVLGGDSQLLWSGLIVTEPGTAAQRFHADAPPVPRAVWEEHGLLGGLPRATLPAHCLTVFVPLVDLRRGLNGPTAFLPGSHHGATAAAMAAEADEAGSSAGAGAAAHLEADAGDAILFDYRLFHAGGANRSAARRPIQYFVYARPWYSDEVNFPGPERTLWPAEVQ